MMPRYEYQEGVRIDLDHLERVREAKKREREQEERRAAWSGGVAWVRDTEIPQRATAEG